MTLIYNARNNIRRYFFSAKMRKRFAQIKEFSRVYIKPTAPFLHSFIFETLKRYLKRMIIVYVPHTCIVNIDGTVIYEGKDKNHTGKKDLKVSIIVPNYNHANFLRKRLESIYSQTYKNFEVILLDDKSTDDSVAILNEFAQVYYENTRLVVNDTNSGGVFFQWKHGIELAKGELIWIAESDDFCSPNLLEKLVTFFDNEAIMLAYTKSIFVRGDEEIWSINDYLADIDKDLWSREFVASAHNLVNKAWSVKNILPNASSAVFRNSKNMKLLDDASWKKMKICGDWIFYLHIIRGGLVAYTSNATNYYRLHDNNSSVSTYSQEVYYREHQMVASTICKLYNVKKESLKKQQENLEKHWHIHIPSKNKNNLFELYNLDEAVKESSARKPNIMMVTFALVAGGGETFPIKLANMLDSIGYSVTMLSCEQEQEELGIRKMLNSNIALLKVTHMENIGSMVEDMGIEIVHSHHAWADLTLCALLAGNKNTKMVITNHGMYEMMSEKEFIDAFDMLKQRVSRVIYTAKKNLAPFKAISPDKNFFTEIGNALDVMPINKIDRLELNISEDAFLVCLVSRAIPEKGWQEAIESIEMARNISNTDIHLLLIGEGSEYLRLKNGLAKEKKFIHFLGFKENIRDYFATSNLGFLPSRFEGESFPLVLIDCMYANKPILASNIGEIANMLKKDDYTTGVVFDLENLQIPVKKVGSIIAKFATDIEFYVERSKHIQEVVVKYDPSEMILKYDSVYTQVVTLDKKW